MTGHKVRKMTDKALLAAAGLMMLGGYAGAQQSQPNAADMTFFVTSVGPGKGADLGGLEGADKHCQTLAKAAGGVDRPWRAYLSTQAPALSDPNFVNARDRIGIGPWQNAYGVVITKSVEDLHSASSKLTKQTAVDEMGRPVNSRGDSPLKHDMLTGSRPDGTAFPGAPFPDMTAATGPGAGPMARRCWAIMIARARPRTRGACPGIRPTRVSAAARRSCALRGATGCSTASQRNKTLALGPVVEQAAQKRRIERNQTKPHFVETL